MKLIVLRFFILIHFLAVQSFARIHNIHDESRNEKNKSFLICNPKSSHLFAKFFIQRWMDARSAIGKLIVSVFEF